MPKLSTDDKKACARSLARAQCIDHRHPSPGRLICPACHGTAWEDEGVQAGEMVRQCRDCGLRLRFAAEKVRAKGKGLP